MVETLKADIGRSRCFSKGVGHFKHKFQGKGTSPTKLCWFQKTRVISLSCDIKISTVCYFVLSQSTHVTDGRTDPQDRASIAASRGRNVTFLRIMVYDSRLIQCKHTWCCGFNSVIKADSETSKIYIIEGVGHLK